MLDDSNVLKQRDPKGTLEFASNTYQDASWQAEVVNSSHDGRKINNIIIAGMGGSALAADIVVTLLSGVIDVPLSVVKTYNLPKYVDSSTLIVASSQSGNTEETLSCYQQAKDKGCQLAVLTAGGSLLQHAQESDVMYVKLSKKGQPRMEALKHLRALLAVFEQFRLIDDSIADSLAEAEPWLESEVKWWHREVPVQDNYAKQLAILSAGKTPVFFGGPFSAPLAYKWKISWNENAKNTAFWNQYPEFNHNEFVGWSSHPIEKPFVIFDIYSEYDGARIDERMRLSDRLLSGLRPASHRIDLRGSSNIVQAAWACILADMASCYTAILNGVDPEPVVLVERLKKELS